MTMEVFGNGSIHRILHVRAGKEDATAPLLSPKYAGSARTNKALLVWSLWPDGELTKDCPHRLARGAGEQRPAGDVATALRAEIEPLSGRKVWVKVSSELAQDCRASVATILDVSHSNGDGGTAHSCEFHHKH